MIDRDVLRAAAEAAAVQVEVGEWKTREFDDGTYETYSAVVVSYRSRDSGRTNIISEDVIASRMTPEVAGYVAAVDPDTVVGLLDALAATEAKVARLTAVLEQVVERWRRTDLTDEAGEEFTRMAELAMRVLADRPEG